MSEDRKSLTTEEDWFEEWFRSDYYLKLYSHRDREEAEACVELIVRATGLDPAATPPPRVLDLACGPGRHAVSMAEHGFDVTAVDLSPTLLDYARTEAEEAGVKIRLIRSDMRKVEFHDQFDLVVQLFTSFGYFESHDDDMRVLHEVRDALHPGGYYALDLLNERYLRKSLVRTSVKSFQGQVIYEERHFERDRVVKTIAIPGDDAVRKYHESVRLFSPERIDEMLRHAGLEPIAWYGEYDGSPFDPERSHRMFIVSRAV